MAAVTPVATIAAVATVASVAAIAAMALVAVATVAAVTTVTPVAAVAPVAMATVASAAAVAEQARPGFAVAAQQGHADQRDENRDTKQNNAVHPRILQLTYWYRKRENSFCRPTGNLAA